MLQDLQVPLSGDLVTWPQLPESAWFFPLGLPGTLSRVPSLELCLVLSHACARGWQGQGRGHFQAAGDRGGREEQLMHPPKGAGLEKPGPGCAAPGPSVPCPASCPQPQLHLSA